MTALLVEWRGRGVGQKTMEEKAADSSEEREPQSIKWNEATLDRRGEKVLYRNSEGFMQRGKFITRVDGGKLLLEIKVSSPIRRKMVDYIYVEPEKAFWEG